ncbi:MAG: sterol desaturase family protein, partial [Flavobacteriales bacterium]|nr:sterol desaturase family protein [Flavobacteriales bacterium]
MNDFLQFFEEMPTWQKVVWIIACLSFAWVLEGIKPLFKSGYKKWKHAGLNFIYLAFVMIINLGFGILTLAVFQWSQAHSFGLLYLFDWPVWVELIIAVLIMDLIAQYFVHFLLHKVSFMWRMHMVHHSDTNVDATTGTRHHPGDYILRETFALMAVFLSGAPVSFYLFYRISTIFFTYMTHANISLPLWLDKTISLIFISPNMHKFHHHVERPWTDSNFGNILSVWDRIFGTFVYGDPTKVKYGLDVLDNTRDNDVKYQLGLPFNKDIK